MKIKILSRVVIYDSKNKKLALAKNRDADFWYAPGGGWEYETGESILDCAKREVKEEVGIDIEIERLLYSQEFHESKDLIFFEMFWLALVEDLKLDSKHIDLDPNGMVEQVKWFNQEELKNLTVFPKRLKNTFWENIDNLRKTEDPFIGIN